MTTSFKKKSSSIGRLQLPVGTKPSLHNNQLLISTGIPSLDVLLGGGVAVGTVLLLEEDVHTAYSNIMLKLFLAEGVATGHSLFVASADTSPQSIIKDLPSSTDEASVSTNETIKDEDLKIAWRYQNVPRVSSSISAMKFGHYFDLSETLSEEKINSVKYTCFHPEQSSSFEKTLINPYYKRLLLKIQDVVSTTHSTDSKLVPPILRIALSSLGSPFWNETLLSSEEYDPSLAWFLLSLKAMLRNSYACCLITTPVHLLENDVFIERLERCCDTVIKLESFAGLRKEANPLYNEYHGLFHLLSHTQLNCITGHTVDTSDLAFKLKRKKFSIEKLHLPPDVSATANRSSINTASNLCAISTPVNNLLEF